MEKSDHLTEDWEPSAVIRMADTLHILFRETNVKSIIKLQYSLSMITLPPPADFTNSQLRTFCRDSGSHWHTQWGDYNLSVVIHILQKIGTLARLFN